MELKVMECELAVFVKLGDNKKGQMDHLSRTLLQVTPYRVMEAGCEAERARVAAKTVN